jgi:peroxin-12
MSDNQSAHNPTIPTSIAALLTEECTVDPLSQLPSFLELIFVDVARDSGRRALSAAWAVGVAWLEGTYARLRMMDRLADHGMMMATRRGGGRMDDYSSSGSGGGHPTSVVAARFLKIVRALRAARARILRRWCHLLLKMATTLGPELQTLILYAIDYNCMHYLSGSTACEMMYGLKRSKVVVVGGGAPHARRRIDPSQSGDNAQRGGDHVDDVHYRRRVYELTIFDKTISAILAALLPYCKERCDRLYIQWTEQSNNGSPSYHIPIDVRMNRSSAYIDSMKKFVQLYPYYHMVHEATIFLYQFAYLMGYSSYWSVSLHAMGVILRRMTVADVQQQQQQKHNMLATQNHQHVLEGRALPSQQSTQTSPLQTHGNSFDSAKSALQTTITIPRLFRGAVLCSIAYTLLSGWYSHFQRELQLRRRRWIAGNEDDSTSRRQEVGMDEVDTRRITKLPIPPPPIPPNLIEEIDHNVDKWSCPICKEPRINPTASTSGYVYCYKCLVSHIRNVGEYCPMTGMPCQEDRVVRLFEPTASRRVAHGEINRGASRQ